MLPAMMIKLIYSYLTFFIFLFNMTTLLQLGVYSVHRKNLDLTKVGAQIVSGVVQNARK